MGKFLPVFFAFKTNKKVNNSIDKERKEEYNVHTDVHKKEGRK